MGPIPGPPIVACTGSEEEPVLELLVAWADAAVAAPTINIVNTRNFAVGVNVLPLFSFFEILSCMKKAAIFRRPSDCQPV
jgi:hypothetical protein